MPVSDSCKDVFNVLKSAKNLDKIIWRVNLVYFNEIVAV